MSQQNNTGETRAGFRLSRRGWGGLIAAVVAILLAVAVLVGLSIGKHSANQDTAGGDQTSASASASPSWAADQDKRAKDVATKFTNIWFAEIEPINPSYTYDQWRQDITQYMTADLSNERIAPYSRPGGKVTSVTQKKILGAATAIYTVRTTEAGSVDLKITEWGGSLKVDSVEDSSKSGD
ncbi:hypothetical protein [uncultured Corynebacterium sp.]|uniref:hypothetical protein n=1 Tax=uncultured Corynebacterium sp. TaxID=159447 RepID=UPI0025FB4F02|nr:hypothetical protein [uncultured Corynebacterium sp.]